MDLFARVLLGCGVSLLKHAILKKGNLEKEGTE
jgi:hypothetical protein